MSQASDGAPPPSRGLARASSLTFAGAAVNVVLGFVVSALTARLLGPTGKGIFVLALILPNLIALVSDVGMSVSAVYLAAQRRYRATLLAGNNTVIGLLLAALGIAAGAGFLLLGGRDLFPEVPLHYVLVALLVLPALDVGPLLQNVLLGQQRFVAYNAAAVGAVVVGTVPVLAALLVWRSPFAVIVAQVVGASAFALALAAWLRHDIGPFAWRPSWPYWRESLAYGAKAHVGTVMNYLNLRADSWIIGILLGPAAVGLYSVGVTVMERIWLLPNAVGLVLFPKVAADADADGGSRAMTPLVLRAVLVAAAAIAAVLCVLAPVLVRLVFSSRFLPVVPSMRFLAVGVVALAGGNLLMHDLSGRGRPEIAGYVGTLGAATNIALNLVLVPRHGITGAGMASAVSYGIAFAASLVVYCRVARTTVGAVLRPRRSDVVHVRAALDRARRRPARP